MFFQHDGAPSQFGQPVRNWLNQHFPSRWIGRGGTLNCPARSPDLNSLDYYLWRNMSNIIYATEVDSPEELLRQKPDYKFAFAKTPTTELLFKKA
ncbi:hypothetical protein D910_04694 [Dendroctonus ponderosae]